MNQRIAYLDEINSKDDLIAVVIDKMYSICHEGKNVMVSIYDILNDRFIYCSDSFQNNLGYSCEELCNGGWKYWWERIDTSQVSVIKEEIKYFIHNTSLLRKQKSIFLTYRIKGRSGDFFQLHHEICPYQFQDETVLLNFLYDISAQEHIKAFLGIRKLDPASNGFQGKANISRRENEVLNLLAQGFSSKQIADQLFISTQTVLSHRKHLIEKFSARNTAQLINKAALI
ncbi:MAG TPA: LuxR C-terminal-related transcriptional regulator [Pricia sp.]|nr:LuxR C-terminal-related transcriptional regulator [Pricia sp.]